MSVIELERPAAPAPEHRSWDVWLDAAIRLVLIGILVVSWASLLPASTAVQRPSAQLLGDLKAGKVHSVQFRNRQREVRWTDGGLRWYRADIAGVGVLGLAGKDADATAGPSQGSPPDADYRAWVSRALTTSPRHVPDLEIDTNKRSSWTDQLPWTRLSEATGAAIGGAFVLMMLRSKRRFGTRWTWSWIFLIVGNGVGPFLYLLLEPTPLWRRNAIRPMPDDPAIPGGTGFVVAIALKIAVAIALGKVLSQLT